MRTALRATLLCALVPLGVIPLGVIPLGVIPLGQARAAELEITLPNVVVTATRVPTPLERIPAGVTVVTRRQIEESGFATLSDALGAVPGARVSPSGGPGGQSSFFVRGTNSNHVLVLRDGMPINDPSEATGAFNFGVDTLSDIERIEIVRGPMAALWGSSAIGGVVNLISRRGREDGLHWSGELAGGFPEQAQGALTAHGKTGAWDYAATVSSSSQRGFDAVPQRMSIHSGTAQGFRDRIATLNLGYSPVEGTRFSVFVRGRQALFGFNTLGSPTYDTANSSGSAESFLGRVGVVSALLDGLWETSVHVGHLRDARRYKEPLDPADPNATSQDNRFNATRTDIQWNNTLRLDRFLPGWVRDASATIGYQRTTDTIRVSANSDFGGFPFAQAANASASDDAVHMGAQATLAERVTLTGQARQDWTAGRTPATWRLGAVLHATEIGTDFKLAYGTAFRAPSLFDRFGIDSFGYRGNPGLRPETAQGWEIGFVSKIPAFGQEAFLGFGTTYFNQQVTDLISTVFAPVYTSVNIGSARVQGAETEIVLRPAPWLSIRASHTFTDTVASGQPAATGSRLLRRPPHAASLEARIAPIPGLTIVPRVSYTGAFRDFVYDNGGFGTGFGTSPGGTVAHLSATWDAAPGVQLFGHVWNVFQSRFEPVNGFQSPGASGIVGVRVRM